MGKGLLFRGRLEFRVYDRATQSQSAPFVLGDPTIKWPAHSPSKQEELKNVAAAWVKDNPYSTERFVYLMNTGRYDSNMNLIWEGDIVKPFMAIKTIKDEINEDGVISSFGKVIETQVNNGWVELYRGVFYVKDPAGGRYPLTTNLNKNRIELSGEKLYPIKYQL